MELTVSGKVWFWRGPAPWYFVSVPPEQSEQIKSVSQLVSYGWGAIPVEVCINHTCWKTSLFPKDGVYLVPIRASARKTERLAEGDDVTLQLKIRH